jgi:phosphoglycerate dehydrogenase-like enzyme
MEGTMTAPVLAIVPTPNENLAAAARDGGAVVEPLSANTTGLLVSGGISGPDLSRLLTEHPGIGWVQLPSAGIESYAAALQEHPNLTWTSAKGAYARPVAEHALALTLALLRLLPERAAARSWGRSAGTSLFGLNVLLLGAGGIGAEIIRQFGFFDTTITAVRRGADPVPGAARTVSLQLGEDSEAREQLGDLLAEADVVVLAAALTDESRGMIGAAEFARMKSTAVLVNIGRGGLIDTDALVKALDGGELAGAGLDVTDPEPLPDGHPLWDQPGALITPHTANTSEMAKPLIADRVRENVRRWAAGESLDGGVDPGAGY